MKFKNIFITTIILSSSFSISANHKKKLEEQYAHERKKKKNKIIVKESITAIGDIRTLSTWAIGTTLVTIGTFLGENGLRKSGSHSYPSTKVVTGTSFMLAGTAYFGLFVASMIKIFLKQ